MPVYICAERGALIHANVLEKDSYGQSQMRDVGVVEMIEGCKCLPNP